MRQINPLHDPLSHLKSILILSSHLRLGLPSCLSLTFRHQDPVLYANYYRDAGKSLARPRKKQENVCVRMAWISFGALPCKKKKLDDISRLHVVEIARVPDMLSSLFRSWSG